MARKLANHLISAQIGQRLKKLRNKRRMSQQEISKRLGISENQYYKYEAGRNTLTLASLQQVAEVLGVQPCEICGCKDEEAA